MPALWVALEHKWAVVVTDDEIHEAIARDIAGCNGDRGVKFADFVLCPFYSMSVCVTLTGKDKATLPLVTSAVADLHLNVSRAL